MFGQLKIFIHTYTHPEEVLGKLCAGVDLYLLLELDAERGLDDLDHGVPAAGVHHPLLDRDRVTRHRVDKHCGDKRQ